MRRAVGEHHRHLLVVVVESNRRDDEVIVMEAQDDVVRIDLVVVALVEDHLLAGVVGLDAGIPVVEGIYAELLATGVLDGPAPGHRITHEQDALLARSLVALEARNQGLARVGTAQHDLTGHQRKREAGAGESQPGYPTPAAAKASGRLHPTPGRSPSSRWAGLLRAPGSVADPGAGRT